MIKVILFFRDDYSAHQRSYDSSVCDVGDRSSLCWMSARFGPLIRAQNRLRFPCQTDFLCRNQKILCPIVPEKTISARNRKKAWKTLPEKCLFRPFPAVDLPSGLSTIPGLGTGIMYWETPLSHTGSRSPLPGQFHPFPGKVNQGGCPAVHNLSDALI